jgi:cell division septation protein DedD
MLKGKVRTAPDGSVGFDCDTPLTSGSAGSFVRSGFHFAVRYLSLGAEAPGDLSTTEAWTILGSGLALMAVQHVPGVGWNPTQELGSQYGKSAATNAQSVGLPHGLNIWLDLEGVSSSATASSVSAYCNAWFGELSEAGYVPGLYVGANSVLDADELDALSVEHFWKSGSNVAYPSSGYCMIQVVNSSYVVDGIAYDRDTIQSDNLGRRPLWLAEHTKPTLSLPTWASKTTEASGDSSDSASATSTSAGKSVSSRSATIAGIVASLTSYAVGVGTGPLFYHSGSSGTAGESASSPAVRAKQTTEPPTSGTDSSVNSQLPPAVVPATTGKETPADYELTLGSFSQRENADRLAQTLSQGGYGPATVDTSASGGRTWYVVHLGHFVKQSDASSVVQELKDKYDVSADVRRSGGS